MKSTRRWMLLVVVATAAVGGPAAVALADDAGVRAAIESQDQIISQSPQLKELSTNTNFSKSHIGKLERLIKAVEPKLTHAAKVVAATQASTAKGTAGRNAWVKGVRDFATGYKHVGTELKDLQHNNAGGAKRQLLAARKVILAGQKLVLTADRDLGLPKGD